MAPKGLQFEPQGHQNEPKGRQRDAKSEPKINKYTTKNHDPEKGRFRGVKCNICFVIFDPCLVQKYVKKSMRKTVPEKASKTTKNIPKNKVLLHPLKCIFSHVFCQGGSFNIAFLLENNIVF